jgi:hypothetical protein
MNAEALVEKQAFRAFSKHKIKHLQEQKEDVRKYGRSKYWTENRSSNK